MSIQVSTAVWETLIDNFAKTVTRTPITKTTSNTSGDETLTEGSTESITVAFFKREDSWLQDKEGLIQGADAIMLVKTSQTLVKNDKITFDSEDFRIQDVVDRYIDGTKIYITARLFRIT